MPYLKIFAIIKLVICVKIEFKINERKITFIDIKDLLISETEKDYSIPEEIYYYEVNVDKIDKKLFSKKRMAR